MLGSERVSKRSWYNRGGFSNPRCWRRMVSGGWHYFYRHD
jgi:hypothetical protein